MRFFHWFSIFVICLSACKETQTYDFENIDFSKWEEARINELNILLPEIRELYLDANPNKRKKSAEKITIGVLSDYTSLMEYAYLPRKAEVFAAKTGNIPSDVFIFDSFDEKDRTNKLNGPKDFTIFNPHLSYSKHTYKTCELECETMIFENRVNSITIVNETRNRSKEATRYSMAPCNEQDSDINHKEIRKLKLAEFASNIGPEQCLVEEKTEVPKYGYFSDRSSPLWPEEFESKNKKLSVFTDLNNIKTSISTVDHWSYISPTAPNATLRYEKICLKISPELPDNAAKFLAENLAKNKNTHMDSQSGTKRPISVVTFKNGNIDVKYNHQRFHQQRKITYDDGRLCFEPRFPARNSSPHRGRSFRDIVSSTASTKNIIEQLNEYKFDQTIDRKHQRTENEDSIEKRRTNYLRQLGSLAFRPDYYEDIFPSIAPRFFDTTSNGLGGDDGSVLAGHFHRSSPPLGSLSSYAQEIEKLFERHLKKSGCSGWECPQDLVDTINLKAHYNILAAVGPAGIPLLQKIETAGFKDTEEVEICLGALTPNTKAKYLELLRSQPNHSILAENNDRPKHHIRALLITVHRPEVFAYIEKRLSFLKNEALNKEDDKTNFKTQWVSFSNGIPTNFFKTQAGNRYREMRTIEMLLYHYQSSSPPRTCSYHNRSFY